MIEVSHLQCPYKVFKDPNAFSYYFDNIHGIKYNVIFRKYNSLFEDTTSNGIIDNIYSLDLIKISGNTEVMDIGVRKTVDAIVQQFFDDNNNILYFMCDISDARQYKRMLAFDRWYKMSMYKSFVVNLMTVYM